MRRKFVVSPDGEAREVIEFDAVMFGSVDAAIGALYSTLNSGHRGGISK